MNRDSMEEILASLLRPEDERLDPPTEEDWCDLCSKFDCTFSTTFMLFIALMAKYKFPGDIYNVSSGITNGNDPIALVYDLELEMGAWNPRMIPFYGIGNGDYFCLNKAECPNSPVYYFYLDRNIYEKYSENFEEWVRHLPEFLA